MVKVLAPALSLEASGSLGGALVFSTWKGRPYVRTLVKPSNPNTPMQNGIRQMMKFLGQQWDAIKAAYESSWQDLADNKNISPFNAYVGTNMAAWRSGSSPTMEYPPEVAMSATAIDTFSAVAGPRNIAVSYSLTASADQWGVILCRGDLTGFTPSWANAIAVVYAHDTDEHVYVDAPLEAGEYFYRMAAFTQDGVTGVFKGEITGTVV